MVRDSSRKTATHPYVLMVLYRDKVYNIQIRYQEQNHVYLLGTGLKGKEVLCVFHTTSLHLKVSPVSFLSVRLLNPAAVLLQWNFLVVLELFLIEYVTAGSKIRFSCLHSGNEGTALEYSY